MVLLLTAPILAACGSATEPGEVSEIVSHDDGLGYLGYGWICHGVGTGDLEMPFEGPDDHTGYTEEECMLPDCHVVGEQK